MVTCTRPSAHDFDGPNLLPHRGPSHGAGNCQVHVPGGRPDMPLPASAVTHNFSPCRFTGSPSTARVIASHLSRSVMLHPLRKIWRTRSQNPVASWLGLVLDARYARTTSESSLTQRPILMTGTVRCHTCLRQYSRLIREYSAVSCKVHNSMFQPP